MTTEVERKKRYFGDRNFYKYVIKVALPIMIQNGFMNLMNLVDNLMVGQIGTDQMSGVAIINQLIFIFNLSIFGALSGAGIFVAQYYGSGDRDGVKKVFRMKLLIALLITIIGLSILSVARIPLITQFLHDGSMTGDPEATLGYALRYIRIVQVGLFPFAYAQCYVSTLRETGETMLPMKAGIASVLVNVCLNYILIYGKCGLPALGVEGAALATVTARFVECAIVVLFTQKNAVRFDYMHRVLQGFYIPGSIIRQVILKGTPLLLNEFLWSAGVTMLTMCYSTRGLAVVAGINICNTINNVFNIVMIAGGSAASIIVGQLLGAGQFQEARDTARKLIVFSVLMCTAVGILMAVTAPFFPLLYNTTQEVRSLATGFIFVMAAMMPFGAFTNASYFILRSGGKTVITFLFDSCFEWGVCVVAALLLAYGTKVPILPMYLICQSLEILKCIIGYFLVKGGGWVHNLSEEIR